MVLAPGIAGVLLALVASKPPQQPQGPNHSFYSPTMLLDEYQRVEPHHALQLTVAETPLLQIQRGEYQPPTTSTTSGPSSSTATTSPTPTQPPSTPPLPTPTSNNLHATMRLFTLLSSHSELDHPLCADCTNTLTENLERKLEETRRERDGYIAFEKEVKKSRESITASGLDEKKLEHKIQRLEQESLRAIADLRAAEQERIALEAEIAAIKEEEDALEEEEIAFWTERSRTQLQQTRAKDQLASITAALSSTQREIASLSRTNVYNDAFCIGHDGMFGTINGLRLGRSTSAGGNVEWAEINAAWGQALLLLYTIARKVEFTFDTYRLVPMGSFSKIERISGDRGTYELYGSGDLNLTRMLHNRRFDHAMIAFLECLRQLMDHVRARDPSIDFPHLVVKDKIGDVSIKLQFNNEEVWTKAMRHVLLALKILLRWATSG
ncbi:APG6-domain-containing protein [Clavulina sp. PMI_390]|nr:APG6-domain-containing protein [Clavulina sp. PMI_390]